MASSPPIVGRIPRPSNLRTARVSRARSVSWFGVLKYSKQLEDEYRVTAGKPIKLIKLLKLLMAPFCWIVLEGLSFWKKLMITLNKIHPAPVGSCSAIFRSRPMSRSASFLLCRWEGCCWLQISSSMYQWSSAILEPPCYPKQFHLRRSWLGIQRIVIKHSDYWVCHKCNLCVRTSAPQQFGIWR